MTKLKIDLPQKSNKISLHLKQSTINILDEYKTYLSNIHDADITYEIIFEALIKNIEKDRDFKKFRISSQKKQNIIGATSTHKEDLKASETEKSPNI